MPFRAPKPCPVPGCAELVQAGRCNRHRMQDRRRRGDNRPSAWRRGYDGTWNKFASRYRKAHPLCALCGNAATEVDHIRPLAANPELKYDPNNLQALCHQCHSRKTAVEDGGGWGGKTTDG